MRLRSLVSATIILNHLNGDEEMKRTIAGLIESNLKSLAKEYQKLKFISPTLTCKFESFLALLSGRDVRFYYNKNSLMYTAVEGHFERYFFNLERGLRLYKKGISERGQFLFHSYCLQNLEFEDGDVIIDCGANSGDLSIELLKSCPKIKYIGVEPAPQDFQALSKNVTFENATLLNKALGQKNGELRFYISSDKGDSSILEPPVYTHTIDVEVVRVDTLAEQLGLKQIKLLKIEAEGFEPEILTGARGAFSIIEYISVDGGYERGLQSEQTFTAITNLLLNNDFEIIDIYFPWHRALFKNKLL